MPVEGTTHDPGVPQRSPEAGETGLQLMDVHIETLFRCDRDGRLLSVNERGAPTAPRFFMGRTAAGNLWRFRYDLPSDTVRQLEPLCRSEPVAGDLRGSLRNGAAIRAVLQAHAPIQSEECGPAFLIPAGVTVPTHVVLISEANAHLLGPAFAWLRALASATDREPIAAATAGGQTVAVCFCSRLPGRAAEAGVETLEAYRGRGYGSAAVAGWAAAMRRRGIIPLYSTSWDNLASQGVARKLGLVLYGDDWSVA